MRLAQYRAATLDEIAAFGGIGALLAQLAIDEER
jgi:hypothetical protein